MKIQATYAPLILLLALLLCGAVLPACSHRGDEAEPGPLPEIERMLHSRLVVNPDLDSAVAMLGAVRPEELKSPEARALYDLLCKEADYKLYRETPDDSALMAAAGRFKAAGDSRRLMRALFHIGRARFVNGDFAGSLKATLEARDIAEELNDTLFLAKTSELCADDYCRGFNYSEALKSYREACSYYHQYGWDANTMVNSADASICMTNLGKLEAALALLDSVLESPADDDPYVLAYVYEARVRPNLSLGRLADARAALDSTNKYDPSGRFTHHMLPVVVDLHEGNYKEAGEKIEALKQAGYPDVLDSDILYLEYEYYKLTGDEANAAKTNEQLSSLEVYNLTRTCVLGSELSYIDKDHHESLITDLEGNLSKYRWRTSLMGLVALALLIALALISVAVYRHRAEKSRLSRALEEKSEAIAEYARMLEEQKALLEQKVRAADAGEEVKIPESMAEMMRQQITTLNSLCTDYYDKKNSSEKVRLSMLNDMESHLSRLAETDYIRQVELYLDVEKDGVASKLRALLPNLSKKDLTLVLLSMTRLSAKAICVICGYSSNIYYYNRRRILRARLQATGSPAAEEILKYLM